MNKQIRRLGIVLVVCYLALFVKLNRIQVLEADDLNDNPDNTRRGPASSSTGPAAPITSADGALLAQQRRASRATTFKRERELPRGRPVRPGHRLLLVRVRQRPASRRPTTTS